jgi:hypothetical protein
VDELGHGRDEPTLPVGGRPRYGRDWLIAAGSVVPVLGVAFPFYLAWRDDRRRWVAACLLLFLGALAGFPLSDAGDTIDGIAILVVWLAGMAVSIVLASTVSPENRRASAKDLAAHRRPSRRLRLSAPRRPRRFLAIAASACTSVVGVFMRTGRLSGALSPTTPRGLRPGSPATGRAG